MAKHKAKETKVKPAPAKKATRAKVAAAAEPVVTTAAKVVRPQVEDVRIVQNGVKRPKDGGACAAVWSALDQMHAAGVVVTAKDARDLATAKGWNPNNAQIEMYAWRKFMGISKRSATKAKRKTVAKEAVAVVTEATPAESAS